MSSTRPTLRVERSWMRSGDHIVVGMDEVGRGAIAGPVSVGVVAVATTTPPAPSGVRDSKLLTPMARQELAPRIRAWALGWAVGHASNREIDERGIIAALRLAGMRALARLDVVPDRLLLDGNHDWLSGAAQSELFGATQEPKLLPERPLPAVTTLVKADRTCSSVAAASVLAKVERDAYMVAVAEQFPQYHWASNKGYSAPEHVAGLHEHGPCTLHRISWRLAGQPPGRRYRPGGPAGVARSPARTPEETAFPQESVSQAMGIPVLPLTALGEQAAADY